jgi:hypothetical protein
MNTRDPITPGRPSPLLMPRAKHRRKGKTRPRGKPPRMPWMPLLPEKDEVGEAPDASDLLDWHPRIQREPDPRQGDLFAV